MKNYINCANCYRYKQSGGMCHKGHVHEEDCNKCDEWTPDIWHDENGERREP